LAEVGAWARIQLGLRNGAEGTILIEMRAVFAAPVCLFSAMEFPKKLG
jgi:hypothetical protein